MQGALAFAAFLLLASSSSSFNVMDYGAAGNGQTDDSQAFNKAWKDVCSASMSQEVATLRVPQGKTFLLNPIVFQGPCKASSIHFQLGGTLTAPQSTSWADEALDSWIRFSGVDNLILDGNGTFDGQGSIWWQSCNRSTIFETSLSCKQRPSALYFHNCNGLRLRGLTHMNSPRSHIAIYNCKNVVVSNLHIIAPEHSPNTDGIDIADSTNLQIHKSRIETGDDCVAINGGSSFINITGVECGPGHGISIGSLGDGGAYDTVEDVHVKNCNIKNTTNGVRIKTFQGSSGFARRITFKHIGFENVSNPIIINQFYEDRNKPSNGILEVAAAIEVSEVTYSDLHGTSASERAIDLNCDNVVGCTKIVMRNINISSAVPGLNIYGSCNNAHGTATSILPELPCLS